jgi:hypothetical protein
MVQSGSPRIGDQEMLAIGEYIEAWLEPGRG